MRCLDWQNLESFERVELLILQDASTANLSKKKKKKKEEKEKKDASTAKIVHELINQEPLYY